MLSCLSVGHFCLSLPCVLYWSLLICIRSLMPCDACSTEIKINRLDAAERKPLISFQRQIRVRVLLDSVRQLSSSSVNCICVCIVALLVLAGAPCSSVAVLLLIRSNIASPCHVAVAVISGSGHVFFFSVLSSSFLFFFKGRSSASLPSCPCLL